MDNCLNVHEKLHKTDLKSIVIFSGNLACSRFITLSHVYNMCMAKLNIAAKYCTKVLCNLTLLFTKQDIEQKNLECD